MFSPRVVLPASAPAATSSPSPLRGTVEFLDAWLADPHSPPVDVDYVSELVEDYIARLSGRCDLLGLPLDADSLRQLRRSHPILKYCLVYTADLLSECSHDLSALLVSRMSALRRLLWSFGASRRVRLWRVSLSDRFALFLFSSVGDTIVMADKLRLAGEMELEFPDL